ncbi:hypothetical protein LC613_32510 [Nostoc sphaeroides CHAB 2801]|nr:hypothetical protein [Nostoc sphaeroides]MCC5632359.1 hypothetical protein [Nostoc sphaeroides CHAB 2801]
MSINIYIYRENKRFIDNQVIGNQVIDNQVIVYQVIDNQLVKQVSK